MFQTEVVDEIKTHIFYLISILRQSCHLWDNDAKYYRLRMFTIDNIRHRRDV